MNFFQRLRFLIFGTPYVVIHSQSYGCSPQIIIRPVHFINGVPYSSVELGEYGRIRLNPMGKCYGYYKAKLWEPAVPSMNFYYQPPSQ